MDYFTSLECGHKIDIEAFVLLLSDANTDQLKKRKRNGVTKPYLVRERNFGEVPNYFSPYVEKRST